MAPKKGKKGKKGKKENLTDEERIALEAQKKLQEEEKKKQKEDLLEMTLKDRLMKEEKFTKFNLTRINERWRTTMRELKSQELKREIEILSQTFERIVDRKESVIKGLAKHTLEAEEQFEVAHRSHLQNIDELVALQEERVQKLQGEYGRDQTEIKTTFDAEMHEIQHGWDKELSDLEDILYAMEKTFEKQQHDLQHEYGVLKEELRNKSQELKSALRGEMAKVSKELWEEFKSTLNAYQTTTADKRKEFDDLKAKDGKAAKEIDMQMRKLQRISDNLSAVKSKIAQTTREGDERVSKLKEERESLIKHFQDLKGQMNELREQARERLTKLTMQSNQSLKTMKRQTEVAEKVIKFAEMCRKLETEEEKVLPFYPSTLTEEEKADITAALSDSPAFDLTKNMDDYSQMDNFWKRFNKGLLESHALEREKVELMKENQRLRSLLKQYLDGISVNDEVLRQLNPLFIVNEAAQMSVPVTEPRVARQKKLIIEAATAVRTMHHAPLEY